MLLLKKYGTDFHILSNFFPKKTKNQLKVSIYLFRIVINNILVHRRSGRKKKDINSKPSVCFLGKWNRNIRKINRT
jgi:hypothetical protein